MESEEGEIFETFTATQTNVYDPAYEWPGAGEPSDNAASYSEPPPPSQRPVATLRPNQPTFRLIVLRTSILPSKHRLGLIDGHSEVQFGRDVVPTGSTTPKIRLKEMEVSKLHATVYWDASRREWGVVDMGSVHGTFLKPASASVSDDDRGTRLSPPRQASIPKKLNHLDRLTIGGTTFLIHMHKDLPCEECQTDGSCEIPLRAVFKSSKPMAAEPLTTAPRALDDGSSPYTPKAPTDPKKALTMLKQSLLTRHSESSLRTHATLPTDQSYIDRSARRRALIPATPPDAPGVSIPCPSSSTTPSPRSKSPVPEPKSQPPAPLSSSNIGHRLLMKQGWEPGTALGSLLETNDGRIGLVEPIELTASLNRGGLGLKRASTTSLPALTEYDWKESAKRRRWERS